MKKKHIKPAMQVIDTEMDFHLLQSSNPVQNIDGNSDMLPGEGSDGTGRARSFNVWDDEEEYF